MATGEPPARLDAAILAAAQREAARAAPAASGPGGGAGPSRCRWRRSWC
ncbi:MAG: hypothetical protein MZV49_06010 [Rhodopseudomonas palustris]|nr:hypothetical protein [Rhodopseudomonas palustris]